MCQIELKSMMLVFISCCGVDWNDPKTKLLLKMKTTFIYLLTVVCCVVVLSWKKKEENKKSAG